jgi:hypothetical protein
MSTSKADRLARLKAEQAAIENESEDEDQDMKAVVHAPSDDDDDEPSPAILQAQQDRADDEAEVAKAKTKFAKRKRRVITSDDEEEEEIPRKKKKQTAARFFDSESIEVDDDSELEDVGEEVDENGYAIETPTVVKKSLAKLDKKNLPAPSPSYVQANSVAKKNKLPVITPLTFEAEFFPNSTKPYTVVHVGQNEVPMRSVMQERTESINKETGKKTGSYDIYLLNPNNINDWVYVKRELAMVIMQREAAQFPERYQERILAALGHNNLLRSHDGGRQMFLPQAYWTTIKKRYEGKSNAEVITALKNARRVAKPKSVEVKKTEVEVKKEVIEEPTVIIPPTPKDFIFDESLCEVATEFILSVLAAGYSDAAFNATAGKWLGYGNNGQGCVSSISRGPPETALDHMKHTYQNDLPRFIMHWGPYLLPRGKEMLLYKMHEDRAKLTPLLPSPFANEPFPV